MTALVLFNENFRNRSDDEILPLAADDEERPPDELCPEFEEEELPEAKTSIDVSADEAVLCGLENIRNGLNLAIVLFLVVAKQHRLHDTAPFHETVIGVGLLVDTGLGCPEAQSGFVRVKV